MQCGWTGGDEDTSTYHPTKAKTDEVEPAESPLHVDAGSGSSSGHFVERSGNGEGPAGKTRWGLRESMKVSGKA